MKVRAIQGTINANTVQTTVGTIWRQMTDQLAQLAGNTSGQVIQLREALSATRDKITAFINDKAPAEFTTWPQRLAWADTMPASYIDRGTVETVLADVGAFVNRVNPLLAAGRAAVLALVADNYDGLAVKMAARDPSRVRAKWESYGGKWENMTAALAKGTAAGGGIGFLPALPTIITTMAAGGQPSDPATTPTTVPPQRGGLETLWKAAQPLLQPILSLLGLGGSVKPPSADAGPASEKPFPWGPVVILGAVAVALSSKD